MPLAGLAASEATAQQVAPGSEGRPALSLLDFVPPALHAGIRARQRTEPVHEAVQRWLDAVAESGRPGHIPAGRYAVSGTATWSKEGDSQGPILVGDGGRTSVFAPTDFPGGPVFRFDGSSRRPNKHALHMRLRDFGIVADRGATAAGTVGIELIGMLYADIERLFVSGLAGDAFSIPERTDIGANPDAYTTQVTLRSVYVDGCGGWAVRSTAGLGLNLKLDDPYFVRNRAGGVFQGGGLFYCERGTISFNGSPEALRQYEQDPATGSRYGGGGICIAWLGGAAIGPRIVQTELETNYGYNLWCEAAGSLVTQQIKSNSSTLAFGGGEVRPPVHFRLGHGRGIVINYTSINDNFRGKALADEPETSLLGYDWDPTLTSDHLVINPYFAVWSHPGARRYSDTRAGQRITILEENRPVRGTPEAAISRIAAAATVPRGEAPLAFAAEEFDPHGLFDAASGAFRAASDGLYQLSAMIHVQASAGGAVRLVASVNGAPAAIVERSLEAGEGTSVEMNTLLPLAAGDTLAMRLAHDLDGEVSVRADAGYGRLAVFKQG